MIQSPNKEVNTQDMSLEEALATIRRVADSLPQETVWIGPQEGTSITVIGYAQTEMEATNG